MKKYARLFVASLVLLLGFSGHCFTQVLTWETAGISLGSTVSTLVFAPNGHLFAYTTSPVYHVYRSTDYGDTWQVVDGGIRESYFAAMTVSQKTGTLLVGRWDTIWRSTNEGGDWTAIPMTKTLMNMASGPDGTIFAGTPLDGPLRSTDDGLTWEHHYSGLTQWSMYSFAFEDSVWSYVSSYSGAAYRSSDNGSSWTPIPLGVSSDVLSMSAMNNGNIFAGTSDFGVYFSSDRGTHWAAAGSGYSSGMARCVVHNALGNIFIATPGGVYRLRNVESSWGEEVNGMLNTDVYSLAFGPDGRLYAGTDSGQVFRTTQSTNAVQSGEERLPGRFSLAQIYPNPFNPAAAIRFEIPVDMNVQLKVYDINGAEVAVIYAGPLPAGVHTMRWVTENLPSGVYICRLQSGTMSDARKILLLR
jgi:hypothetical protein